MKPTENYLSDLGNLYKKQALPTVLKLWNLLRSAPPFAKALAIGEPETNLKTGQTQRRQFAGETVKPFFDPSVVSSSHSYSAESHGLGPLYSVGKAATIPFLPFVQGAGATAQRADFVKKSFLENPDLQGLFSNIELARLYAKKFSDVMSGKEKSLFPLPGSEIKSPLLQQTRPTKKQK